MKPKIQSEVEEIEIRSWGAGFAIRRAHVRWVVSCPCHRRGEFAIVILPSWEAALDVALLHWRTFHLEA